MNQNTDHAAKECLAMSYQLTLEAMQQLKEARSALRTDGRPAARSAVQTMQLQFMRLKSAAAEIEKLTREGQF